jgi:hypothetical protein
VLPDGDYTLTLWSGDGFVEDVVGNDLDGESIGGKPDGTPSGDGVPGGDYVIDFAIDAEVISLPPWQRVFPGI